jgi:hypothetical protein
MTTLRALILIAVLGATGAAFADCLGTGGIDGKGHFGGAFGGTEGGIGIGDTH